MHSTRTLKFAFLSWAVVLIVQGGLFAQHATQTQTAGKVAGSIQDRFGQLIQEATIVFEAKVDGKKIKRKTKTNRDGVFEILLPAGVYAVSIKYSGFRDFRRRDLLVENGKTRTLDVVLEIDPKKTVVVNE